MLVLFEGGNVAAIDCRKVSNQSPQFAGVISEYIRGPTEVADGVTVSADLFDRH
jgi:hypothetical protein